MRMILRILAISAVFVSYLAVAEMQLFDGKSFTGWNGDTNTTWRIENGALVGGSLASKYRGTSFSARSARSLTLCCTSDLNSLANRAKPTLGSKSAVSG
jgi:hypothetical protein